MSAAAVRPLPSVRVVETIVTAAVGRRTLYRFDVWTGDPAAVAFTLTAEGPLGRLRAVARLETLGYLPATDLHRAEPAAPIRRQHTSYAALSARLRKQGIL